MSRRIRLTKAYWYMYDVTFDNYGVPVGGPRFHSTTHGESGEQVTRLPWPHDKVLSIRAVDAAHAFEQAVDWLVKVHGPDVYYAMQRELDIEPGRKRRRRGPSPKRWAK